MAITESPVERAVASHGSGNLGYAARLPPSGLIAIVWAGFAFATVLVALRLFARFKDNRRLWPDDLWILFAWIVMLASAVLETLEIPSLYLIADLEAGIDKVVPDVDEMIKTAERYEFVIIGFFWTITWSVKASFLALYWRLFADMPPMYRRACMAVGSFTFLAYVGNWISSAWTCHPPRTYFEFERCSSAIDNKSAIISVSYSTAVDILTDLMIMALPIPALRALQVTRQQRLSLFGIFSVSLLVVAAAIVRLTQIIGRTFSDPVGLALWTWVEVIVSLIVGCLPAMKSFLGRQLVRPFHHTSRGGGARTDSRAGTVSITPGSAERMPDTDEDFLVGEPHSLTHIVLHTRTDSMSTSTKDRIAEDDFVV